MSDTSLNIREDLSGTSPEETGQVCDIAVLAYQLWEERGRPEGDPEHDWYEAERCLNGRNGRE
jgi:Protein of unknown function (DUF2934)